MLKCGWDVQRTSSWIPSLQYYRAVGSFYTFPFTLRFVSRLMLGFNLVDGLTLGCGPESIASSLVLAIK